MIRFHSFVELSGFHIYMCCSNGSLSLLLEFHRSFDLAIIGLSIPPAFLLYSQVTICYGRCSAFCSHWPAFGWRSTLFVDRITRTHFGVPLFWCCLAYNDRGNDTPP
jgi:hypothetical protein